ncbi:MAG: AMP-binding protein [Nitriliruptoraceae bacterium]
MTAVLEHTGPGASATPTRTLPRCVRDNAARFGDGVCLREKRRGIWQDITFTDYAAQIELFAHGLAALGMGPGDVVAIHAENRPEWLYADVAINALRAITMGLYPTNPAAEVRYLLQDAGARVLLAEDQEQVDKALEVESDCAALEWIVVLEPRGVREYRHPKLVHVADLLERAREHLDNDPGLLDRHAADARDDDVVTLIYTSGTTGPPKGAMLTNRNVTFAMDVLIRQGGIFSPPPTRNDVLLSYLPLCHVAERAATTWTNAEAGVVIHFAESIDTVQANLREVQPTLFFAVPRIWEKIHGGILVRMSSASPLKRLVFGFAMALARRIGRELAWRQGRHSWRTRVMHAVGHVLVFRAIRDRIGLRRVRAAGSGAAPIAPEVLEFFAGIGVLVTEIYGMTENAAVATSNRPGRIRFGTVGEPLPGTELHIDEETGEILTRHAGVFAGYWNRPDDTAAALDGEGWLHTGDVGEWVEGTHVRIVDRIKDIIITAGGKNVSPSEIENALKTSPFIREAVVFGDRQSYLVALIGIELDTVGNWAQRRRIPYTTYRDLTTRREVLELVQKVVRETNDTFARVENIRRFRVIPRALDHEDGDLTATQKVRRASLYATYQHLVDDMYDGRDQYPGGDLTGVHGYEGPAGEPATADAADPGAGDERGGEATWRN